MEEEKVFLVCLNNRTREVCISVSAGDDSDDVGRLESTIRDRFSDLAIIRPTCTLIIQVRFSCTCDKKLQSSARPRIVFFDSVGEE